MSAALTLPPGCTPGDLTALQQCYDDLAKAEAFISTLMIDLINNNPAVAQAIIDAINRTGSGMPVNAVTNGTDAQPDQVGATVRLVQQMPYPNAPTNNNLVTMGILPPGDWDCWAFATVNVNITSTRLTLVTTPPGFSDTLQTGQVLAVSGGAVLLAPATNTVRALTTVDSLITFSVDVNNAGLGPAPGTMTLVFMARRRR